MATPVSLNFQEISIWCCPSHDRMASLETLYLYDCRMQKGADVNASANGGITPLHVAVDQEDERMVDCLLAAGANPNAADDVLNSPHVTSLLCF